MKLAIAIALALCVGVGGARADDDPIATELAALHDAARCPDGAMRVWCLATDGWAAGKPARLPRGAHVFVGLTIELEIGKDLGAALVSNVSLTALAVRTEHGEVLARITNIKPDGADEEQAAAAAIAELAARMKGKQKRVALDAHLAAYLGGLPAGASYPVKRGAHGWTFAGASTAELRRVGSAWVSIERPLEGPAGFWLTIYTDRYVSE